MGLDEYLGAIRRQWLLVLFCVLASTAAAGLLAWTQPPIYAARAQLFVATSGVPGDLSQTYQGGLFSQQRVLSYAKIVSSPPVVERVIEQLNLKESVPQVQEKIRASVPTDTVLIDVTVEDRSPTKAKAIADAVVGEFPRFVVTLERPQDGRTAPVKLTATSQARLPTDPVSPRKPVYIALGILFGLALGIAMAVFAEALKKRTRSEAENAATVGGPVLGSLPRTRSPETDH
jgi:succinoglycan biosynthesis transport protein ExoP